MKNNEIKFAENLHEALPTNHIGNLALLSKDQRDAIAEDFRRWRVCKEVFAPRFGCETQLQIEKADHDIRQFISTLEPEAYKNDMRRRLNSMKSRLKK